MRKKERKGLGSKRTVKEREERTKKKKREKE